MAVNLTTKFMPYVDEMFSAESKKALVTNNDFDWTGAHTVKVHKVNTVAMTDYDRDGEGDTVSRYGALGSVGNEHEEMTLTKDRSFTFAIDKLDNDETNGVLSGASALARQEREVIIPEVDSYVFKKMCTDAGTKVNRTLTAENIYSEILSADAVLDDELVPELGRCIIVTPTTYQLLKKSREITMATEIGEEMKLRGVIAIIDGLNVIKVPGNRLPSGFGFMVCHPVATVAPTKLEDYKVHSDPIGISGELVEGRICYDAFVLENKAKAIYYCKQTASE